MLPVALGIALIMLLAVGHGGEMASERAPQKPGPEPLPPETDASKELSPTALERKRIIVQKGFLAAQQKLAAFLTANRKSKTQQQMTNTIAAYFQSRGIPLQAPNPNVPFWSQPETQIAAIISKVVNSYKPTIVDIGPAQVTGRIGARMGRFPTYVGVGRPRGAPGTEFPTAFDTEFQTAMDLMGERVGRPRGGRPSDRGTEESTEFNTEFNTEYNTAMEVLGVGRPRGGQPRPRGTEDPTTFDTVFNTEFRT